MSQPILRADLTDQHIEDAGRRWRTNNDALAFKWVLINVAISFVVLMAVNLLEKRDRREAR